MNYKEAEELAKQTQEYASKKNSFNKLIKAMKDGDSLTITHIINNFSRFKIQSVLDKLKRSKYKKYPGYEVAVSKLKWRRGW
jgi:hypothetical protein